MGGGGVVKDYTHLVTVGNGYDLIDDIAIEPVIGCSSFLGSITPNYFQFLAENVTINYLYSREFYDQTSLHTAESIELSGIYLARWDTRVSLGASNNSGVNGYTHWRKMLFSASDVGKQVPIWLGYTPPPPWA